MSDHFDPYHVWLGIPPEETTGGRPDHYRLLGLRLFESNPDVISNALDQRRAYLRTVQVGKRAAQSQQLLNEVSAAGICLLDPAKKAAYDEGLSRTQLPPVAEVPPMPPGAESPFAAATPPPDTPFATPRAKFPVVTRHRKAPTTSMVVVAAAVVSSAAMFLFVAIVAAWWILAPRQAANVAMAPSGPEVGGSAVVSPPTAPEVITPVESSPPAPSPVPVPVPAAPTNDRTKAATSQQRVALVFAGRETVHVPLPQEITASGAEFTVETWAWWDPYEPAGRLFAAGSLRVHATKPTESDNPSRFNVFHFGAATQGKFGGRNIQGGRWTHFAVVRSADHVQLFLGGNPSMRLEAKSDFAITSPLVLGDVAGNQNPQAPTFLGMMRDVRVSKGARYSGPFTPEERFAQDENTLVLLDLSLPGITGLNINNLSGRTPPATRRRAQTVLLTPQGEIAGQQDDGSIELLRTASAVMNAVRGHIVQTPAATEIGEPVGRGQLLLPYHPPAEYDVELELTREDGDGGAFVGLEIAGRPAILALDMAVPPDRRTGILPASLGQAASAPLLKPVGSVLATGQRRQITIKVRLRNTDFHVSVERDGVAIADISAPLESLTSPPELGIPLAHGMSIGSLEAKVRFHRVTLRPVTRDFTPQVLASMPRVPPPRPIAGKKGGVAKATPKTATAAPTSVTPATTPTSSAAADIRKPVPSGDALAKAVEEARKIYEGEFKSATKAAQKATLAKRVLDDGKNTQNDAIARYVLIDLARKFFIQGGEVQDAVAAARLLEADFQIPRDELAIATVEALDAAQVAVEQRGELAKVAADLADAAADAEQYERAEKLAGIAFQSAAKQRDAELRKDITQRRTRIGRLVKEWNTVKPSLETLKSNSSDAAANLAAGKFYCFTLEEFDQGLKHLAAGSEPLLADAAKKDTAAQGPDAAKRLEAAAAWQQAATKLTDRDDKQAAARREKWHLELALSGLTGLDLTKANKRLEELKDAGQARSKTVSTNPRTAAGRRGVSLMGRLANGNADAGLLITYEHGYTITNEDFGRMLSAAGITNPQNCKVGLVGGFILGADQTITLHHAGGSSAGGVHRVQIDNRILSTVGDNRIKDHTRAIPLSAGAHVIRWELSGGDFGTGLLELKTDAAATGGSTLIPISVDRTVEAAARQAPTRATIHFGPGR